MTDRRNASPKPSPLDRVPSAGLVFGAIASVQFGASLAVTLFQKLGPGGTVFLRLATAALVLLLIWRPGLRGHSRRELLLALAFGVVLAAMNVTFYEAVDRIPLGIAVAIEFVGPLAVALAGSRRYLDIVWVVLAVAGIVALTRAGAHGLDSLGIVFALSAGCMWGLYILLNARLGQVFAGSTGLALAMVPAALIALPFGIADGGSHLLEPTSLLVGGAVGLLSSAIPYSLEIEALRRIAAPVFGVLMSLEPAVAALAGFLVLGQQLDARALLGIALVVSASLGASLKMSAAPAALG